MILGSHIGASDTEEPKNDSIGLNEREAVVPFTHTPSSWERVWVGDGRIFKPEDVALSTRAFQIEKHIIQAGCHLTHECYLLVWSVTRV